jgi:hypothetical protein
MTNMNASRAENGTISIGLYSRLKLVADICFYFTMVMALPWCHACSFIASMPVFVSRTGICARGTDFSLASTKAAAEAISKAAGLQVLPFLVRTILSNNYRLHAVSE